MIKRLYWLNEQFMTLQESGEGSGDSGGGMRREMESKHWMEILMETIG